MADYISLPVVNVDLRDATMPGSYTTAPDGPHMARYLGATVQATKNGDQYKLHFELEGHPGATRHKLLDLNALAQGGSGGTVDPTILKRAKGDLLAILVSGGYQQNQVAAALGNLNLNQILGQARFHVWHTEGDYNSQTNPNGRWAEIQFLAPDVWAERQRALASQATAPQSNGVQTAGPGAAASAPPAINAGQLAAVMQTGAPGATAPGALPGFGGAALGVGVGSGGGLQIGGAPVGGLPAFGTPPAGGGVGSFLAPGAGR